MTDRKNPLNKSKTQFILANELIRGTLCYSARDFRRYYYLKYAKKQGFKPWGEWHLFKSHVAGIEHISGMHKRMPAGQTPCVLAQGMVYIRVRKGGMK